MAIYHLSIGHVSRSTGRSSVQSAAYITGSCLYESRRDLTTNYENRYSDILSSDTLAPEYASDEFRELSIWDKLESFEDEYAKERYPNDLDARDKYQDSARTAMTIVVAIPKELSVESAKELVEEFSKTRYVSQGLIVTYAMHGDEGNPHAHFQISRRSVDEKGQLSWAKNRDMCTKRALLETRTFWADLTNSYLERDGIEARITEKSFADLGIQLIPTQHRGWVADKLKEMGVTSRIVQENEETFVTNQQRLLEKPELILVELTTMQATFTQIQLLKAVQKRIGDDASLVAQVFESALQKSLTVGIGIDGHVRYTTESYKEKEEAALHYLEEILKTTGHHGIKNFRVDAYLSEQYGHMSEEQHTATIGLIQDNQFSVLVGRAGSGKTTTTVKAVSEMYQQSGFTVIGTSLSALASQNLGREAGIKAKTIKSWLTCWNTYKDAQEKFLSFDRMVDKGVLEQFEWYQALKQLERYQLTPKTVLIIDEAGMVGTSQWHDLLAHAHRAGAKVIAVGDDHQFKAIEAGDFFRELKERSSECGHLFYLNTIRRQRIEWMRQASHHLAELNIQEGLSLYEQQGHIHQTDLNHLEHDIANAYINKLNDGSGTGKEGLVLAFTNQQTERLNYIIRQKLRQHDISGHVLSKTDVLMIKEKGFALGDKVVFLQNDEEKIQLLNAEGEKIKDRFITNGTTGILESVTQNGEIVVVRIDKETTAHFSVKNYDALNHGYALTTHKSQGQTIDFTLVAASRTMDAIGLYVAMTRHRDDVQLFYAKEDFTDFKALALHLSRFDNKDLVKDYTILPENADCWARVQEYQHCVYDAAAILRESTAEGEADWSTYRAIKKVQIEIGKEILNDYESHKLYLNQAGLTQEMLHITTGLKARPLSLAEQKAKLTVEIYGETAKMTRALWHEVRKTYPLIQHPNYAKFQELRDERDALAKNILDNYPLYREFIKMSAKEYGINKKTLENQVEYRHKAQKIEKEKTIKQQNREQEITLLKSSNKVSTTQVLSSQKELKNRIPFERTSAEIVNDLTANIKELALHFLGKPSQQNARQWRYGNKGSIAISVNGTNKGLYSNFESGISGNVVTLIADQLGLSNKEAFKWGVNWLGHSRGQLAQSQSVPSLPLAPSQDEVTSKSIDASDTWTPLFPVQASFPDLKNTPSLLSLLKGRHEVAKFAYKNAEGLLLGYVMRLEDMNGHKITPTLTYCRNDKGDKQWQWKGFGNNRPLYGLDHLKQQPNAPVLVVEGEKTCKAARKLFPQHVVMTWSGGCGSVQKSDWAPLKDRSVTIWPDHDKPGLSAAHTIMGILTELGNAGVKTVDLPAILPHKWDLADKIPEGINIDKLFTHTLDHATLSEQILEKTNPRYEKTFSYAEIYTHAKNSSIEFLMLEENEPLMTHIANETLRELKEWHALTGHPYENQKLQKQASLTGIYTVWSKDMLDSVKKEQESLEKALIIGAIAAKSKIDGLKFRDENGRMYEAKAQYQQHEEKIQKSMLNPSPSIKHWSQDAQREIMRNSLRCNELTGKTIPAPIVKECIQIVDQLCAKSHPAQTVRSVIQEVMSQKVKSPKSLTQVNLERVSLTQTKKELHLQRAIQFSQQKMLQREQHRTLERHHSHEIER